MAWDINQVVLVGRLTRDPELSYTKSKLPICKFSIANNRGGAQGAEEVNFFNITTWDKIASTCSQYLKKGKQVIISGKLKQDRWKDDTGQNRSRIDVTANSVQFIGSKSEQESEQTSPTSTGHTGTPAPANTGQKMQPPGVKPQSTQGDKIDFENFDSAPMGNDEVPF